MKRLIITADDFGVSRPVNEAVVKAYREGILRYASLMVEAGAAQEAARLARENPGLGVGLHLELCSSDPAAWGMRYFFSSEHRGRIEPLIEAQIEKFLSFGLRPTHVDGHMNIHAHPVIFPILARLARRHGIPRIRLPGGEALLSLRFDWQEAPARLGIAAVFGALGTYLNLRAEGLEVPDRTFGLLRSGMMEEDYLLWLIANLPEGLTEIYFHPSSDPASEAVAGPRPGHHTATELRSLLSRRVRDALLRGGISLVSEPGANPLGG